MSGPPVDYPPSSDESESDDCGLKKKPRGGGGGGGGGGGSLCLNEQDPTKVEIKPCAPVQRLNNARRSMGFPDVECTCVYPAQPPESIKAAKQKAAAARSREAAQRLAAGGGGGRFSMLELLETLKSPGEGGAGDGGGDDGGSDFLQTRKGQFNKVFIF